MKTILQTEATMRDMGQPVPEQVTEATPHIRTQRLALDLEESAELAEAYGCPRAYAHMLLEKAAKLLEKHPQEDTNEVDLVGVYDALCDKRVINDGTTASHGMTQIFIEGMTEVKRSNDTKKIPTEKLAQVEQEKWFRKGKTDTIYRKVNGHYVLYNKDGKYLKPSFYSPANLKDIMWPYLTRTQREKQSKFHQ